MTNINGLHKAVGSPSDCEARGTGFNTRCSHILLYKLIMKSFLRSFSPFHWFKMGSWQSYWQKYKHLVLVNPLQGLLLPRNSVVRLNGHLKMTTEYLFNVDVKYQQNNNLPQQQQPTSVSIAACQSVNSFSDNLCTAVCPDLVRLWHKSPRLRLTPWFCGKITCIIFFQ